MVYPPETEMDGHETKTSTFPHGSSFGHHFSKLHLGFQGKKIDEDGKRK